MQNATIRPSARHMMMSLCQCNNVVSRILHAREWFSAKTSHAIGFVCTSGNVFERYNVLAQKRVLSKGHIS